MSKQRAQAGRDTIMQTVRETKDKMAIGTIERIVKNAEKEKGSTISELGLMVIVGQVALVTIIDRLNRGQEVTHDQIAAAINSAAQTMSAYVQAADKFVTQWEETDTNWNQG